MKKESAQTKRAYNAFGAQYHEGRVKGNFFNSLVEVPAMDSVVKSLVKHKNVLDLGCGSGILAKKLTRWGAKVTGIDISERMIEIATRENPRSLFLVGSADEKLPFRKSQFDIVVSSLLVHYIQDLPKLFREVSRIVKPGGSFVFSVAHPMDYLLLQKKGNKVFFVRPYFNNDRKYIWTMFKRKMKIVSFHHTFEEIFNSLIGAGFVIEEFKEPRPLPRGRKSYPKDYQRALLCPSFCIVKTRKK